MELYRALKVIKIVWMGERKEGRKPRRVAVLIQGTEEYTGLWFHPATHTETTSCLKTRLLGLY
jgi:hypothetical protein